VGGISIMNIMLVSVTERTREIALRIAVGARRRDIRWQFLTEALTLALAGGLVGTFLGAGAAVAIALEAGWPILVSPWAVVLACGFAGFVGLSFGLYPVRLRQPGGCRVADQRTVCEKHAKPQHSAIREAGGAEQYE
jgi:putative ABC transport system permease protein